MLYLIGLGLSDEKDISLKGLEAIKECDMVFAENYTANWQGSFQKLENVIGKQIQTLTRKGVEGNFLIEMAKKQKVALLVPGDPLSATTHFQLFQDAKIAGTKCKIIHSSSVFTAVAVAGLQLYKFGRVTTLPKDFKVQSPIEVVRVNKKVGLHSLILLDIGMELNDALTVMEKEFPEESIIVCISLGSESEKIVYDRVKNIRTRIKNTTLPSCIIVPGELNFKEEEALELWK